MSCSFNVLGLGFGLLTIILSYLAPFMGESIVQIPMTIWGVAGAPLFGMFVLAMFFPCANAVVCIILQYSFILIYLLNKNMNKMLTYFVKNK